MFGLLSAPLQLSAAYLVCCEEVEDKVHVEEDVNQPFNPEPNTLCLHVETLQPHDCHA